MTSHPAHKTHGAHGTHAASHGTGHSAGHGRAVALFGGTFDPVHAGHIIVAQAAQRRFHLDAVYFVPSSRPPHKSGSELTPFVHRYAMVALACAEHRGFLPSLAEAPADGATPHFFYTVDTIRRFRRDHPDDHVYFIVGADQFLEIPTWKNYETLLDLCDFIIASRPGFRIDALRLVVPPEKLGRSASHDPQKIQLRKSVIHLLTTVSSHVSSTEVRDRLEQKKNIHGLVPARVEEYILGQALYR
ncbi:MAG TPA: nicotinate-nucleotide adenylyltransferase [Candidatus Acidoferrum sp.]|nr:nicotinate-nucleotide adenylyltransferase [Candidatus Acidoferrum sp.]